MPKPEVQMSRRHPLGPRVTVHVTAEIINTAVRSHSGHCMIAEAIKAAYPGAKHVAVDIATARFTDEDKGFRYVYLTPRVAQDALVDFDEGTNPKPFSFLLRNAHVSSAAQKTAKRKAEAKGRKPPKTVSGRSKLVVRKRGSDVIPDRVGGKRPPQLHVRREFGLRAFRAASLNRLKADQQPDLDLGNE